MARDIAAINAFTATSLYRKRVQEVVEASGFRVEDVAVGRASHKKDWGFVLSLSDDLKALFGHKADILLWTSEMGSFHSRSVVEAQEFIRQRRPRLSEEFGIVFSGSDTAEQEVSQASERLDTHFIGFPLGRLSRFEPFGADHFTTVLQRRLYVRDLYMVTGALTAPGHFFGRQQIINEIESQLRTGGNHIGLFGLRKMGKSSLLFRLLERLRARKHVCPAHVDIQLLSGMPKTVEYFLWTVGQALMDANKALREEAELRMFGRYKMFVDMPPEMQAAVPQYFRHDLEALLEVPSRRIVLLFDEIERMWPHKNAKAGHGWGSTFVDVWRLLRGLDQNKPDRISYFLTGTSPECVETATVQGEQNPMLQYVQLRYLPHLEDEAARELLTRLGALMGLRWERDALDFALRQVGGHPSLLRTFGSAVHKSLSERTATTPVTADHVRSLYPIVAAELNASLRQVVEALSETYPDDFVVLESLALGKVREYQQYLEAAPETLPHLAGYELLDVSKPQHAIRFEALQTWLQQRAEAHKRAAQTAQKELQPGAMFEGYEVLEAISAGGFGSVYRAKKDGAEPVALKIFKRASFDQLMREVEVLEKLKHPNVVRIAAYDKAPDGTVYLATEFLDGTLLEKRCMRSLRLSDEETRTILVQLLGALASFHPDMERAAALLAQEEITEEELDEVQRVRAGYVHRDIKPANVILVEGRGAVLIDFGISSKVTDNVVTEQSTPGYFPPDFDRTRWSPDVDLYQLGLTMLQARLGVKFDGTHDGVASLRALIDAEPGIHPALREALQALSSPNHRNRPVSARSVLRMLVPS